MVKPGPDRVDLRRAFQAAGDANLSVQPLPQQPGVGMYKAR